MSLRAYGRRSWAESKFLVGDFARHQLDPGGVVPPPRQSNVSSVDFERIHQVQQLDLLFDRRSQTDGDCKPSRSVSSSNPICRSGLRSCGSTVFQS
jgi:hypothetical protein